MTATMITIVYFDFMMQTGTKYSGLHRGSKNSKLFGSLIKVGWDLGRTCFFGLVWTAFVGSIARIVGTYEFPLNSPHRFWVSGSIKMLYTSRAIGLILALETHGTSKRLRPADTLHSDHGVWGMNHLASMRVSTYFLRWTRALFLDSKALFWIVMLTDRVQHILYSSMYIAPESEIKRSMENGDQVRALQWI